MLATLKVKQLKVKGQYPARARHKESAHRSVCEMEGGREPVMRGTGGDARGRKCCRRWGPSGRWLGASGGGVGEGDSLSPPLSSTLQWWWWPGSQGSHYPGGPSSQGHVHSLREPGGRSCRPHQDAGEGSQAGDSLRAELDCRPVALYAGLKLCCQPGSQQERAGTLKLG